MPSIIKIQSGRAVRHKRLKKPTSIDRPSWTQDNLFAYKNMHISGKTVMNYKWG